METYPKCEHRHYHPYLEMYKTIWSHCCLWVSEELNKGTTFNLYREKPHGKYITVLQSEVIGIMQAAMKILGQNIVNKSIRISSDSRTALHALEGYNIASGFVLQCRNKLELISRNNRLQTQLDVLCLFLSSFCSN